MKPSWIACLHRVAVERSVLRLASFVRVLAEDLEGLVLGRGREREVARVWQHLPRLHQPIDAVLGRLVIVGGYARERLTHRPGGLAALTRVRLVDDDREVAAGVRRPDVVEHERELLDGRDDDLLAVLEEPAEVT